MLADAKASNGDMIIGEKSLLLFLCFVRLGVNNVAAASIASAADDERGLLEGDGKLDIFFGNLGRFFFDFLRFLFVFESGVALNDFPSNPDFFISKSKLLLTSALLFLLIFEFQ